MDNRFIAAVLGAAALAVPAAAAADPGHEKGNGKAKQAKKVTYVFKGSFTAPGTIAVRSGNAHVKKGGFVDHSVTFDFASARIVAADTNVDQNVDLADVKDGDLVLVQARIAKGTVYAEGLAAVPVVARKLVDKTNAPVEDEEATPPAAG